MLKETRKEEKKEAMESNDIDLVIGEEDSMFSDPEDFVDDITDEGNTSV